MMFCPECGSILVPKKDSSKFKLSCSCGYTNAEPENAAIKETVKSKKEIEVVEGDFETNPLTEEECPKCKHAKAYYWLEQTRSGDEAATKFFKCESCKHIWRDYE